MLLDWVFIPTKSWIIVGSSAGIGAATAVAFAQEGAKLCITGRNQDNLKKTEQKCVAAGAKEEDVRMLNIQFFLGLLEAHQNCFLVTNDRKS